MVARAYILAGIVILIVISAITIYILLSPKTASDVSLAGQFSLTSSKSIVTADSFPDVPGSIAFLRGGTGTYRCFVYMDNLLRTAGQSDCGTRPSQPSCSSGLYEPCKCNALADCTNCIHQGYRQLFSLYGVYNLEVLNVPDASRQNSVSAQLSLRTQAGTDAYVETIPLPPLSLQKWTMITLTKDGRRISVYYNDTLVSSSKSLNMISTMNPSGTVVQAGDSGLSGTIALITMNSGVQTIGEVAAFYSANTDTRGSPSSIVTGSGNFSANIDTVKKSSLLSTLCLDGSCLSFPRVGAALPNLTTPTATASSLYAVQTSYA